MTTELRPSLKKSLWQMSALIAAAMALAGVSNQLRRESLPLVGDWSVASRFADAAGQSMIIELSTARELYDTGAAVFVDARPRSQYREGHIRGALSLPFQEVAESFMEVADHLDGRPTIVTYCDGEGCELSHELALFLKQMGFEDVRVLVNGWTMWQQAGLPTETEK